MRSWIGRLRRGGWGDENYLLRERRGGLDGEVEGVAWLHIPGRQDGGFERKAGGSKIAVKREERGLYAGR